MMSPASTNHRPPPQTAIFLDPTTLVDLAQTQGTLKQEAVNCLDTLLSHCTQAKREVQIIVSDPSNNRCPSLAKLKKLFESHAVAQVIEGKAPTKNSQNKAISSNNLAKHADTWLKRHPAIKHYVAISSKHASFLKFKIPSVPIDTKHSLSMKDLSTLHKILGLHFELIVHPQAALVQETQHRFPHSSLFLFVDPSMKQESNPNRFIDLELEEGIEQLRQELIQIGKKTNTQVHQIRLGRHNWDNRFQEKVQSYLRSHPEISEFVIFTNKYLWDSEDIVVPHEKVHQYIEERKTNSQTSSALVKDIFEKLSTSHAKPAPTTIFLNLLASPPSYNEETVNCINSLVSHCEIAGRNVQIIVQHPGWFSSSAQELHKLFKEYPFAKYITPTRPIAEHSSSDSKSYTTAWLKEHPAVKNFVTLFSETNSLKREDLSTLSKILQLPSFDLIVHPKLGDASPPQEKPSFLLSPFAIFLDEEFKDLHYQPRSEDSRLAYPKQGEKTTAFVEYVWKYCMETNRQLTVLWMAKESSTKEPPGKSGCSSAFQKKEGLKERSVKYEGTLERFLQKWFASHGEVAEHLVLTNKFFCDFKYRISSGILNYFRKDSETERSKLGWYIHTKMLQVPRLPIYSTEPPTTIFLDIDDTLGLKQLERFLIKEFRQRFPEKNPEEHPIQVRQIQSEFYEKEAVKCLETLIRQCEEELRKVQIIVSSTARSDCDNLEDLRALFGKHAFAQYVTGKTPAYYNTCLSSRSHEDELCRGAEIRSWLDVHPEIQRFVALDDDHAHFNENHIPHADVQKGIGLKLEHYPTLHRLLGLKADLLESTLKKNSVKE